MPLIQVLLASTRTARFGERPAAWVVDRLGRREDLDVELVDLRDHPLPFYDLVKPPAHAGREYPDEATAAWAGTIDRADGYVIVTPEYNHGYPAALKNALDHLSIELKRKPIAYVGYGGTGAARAVSQLRGVAAEQDMAAIRSSVAILPELMVPALRAEAFDVEMLAPLDGRLDTLATDLVWWADALKVAREA
ncbi:NAD(P)H-dependent oxidoreductase [Patulibacter sp. NPDC049589]|uniref:NADPH-dependent FMN reductase n=1 Tax=Patulibacter sp. NPDC049589 TaxID=3154731 RepID=UPI0034254AF8